MRERPLILVVDDDPPILLLMSRLLREFGFDAVTAPGGQAALEAAHAHAPDLVVLDRNMPGMSGDDVIRAMRGTESLAETPVIILSGEPLDPGQVAETGAVAALLKPFDVSDLVAAVRRHTGA